MTVAELIAKLQEFPGDARVVALNDDNIWNTPAFECRNNDDGYTIYVVGEYCPKPPF